MEHFKMTEEEFNKYWETKYPESPPIKHELKWIYKDRWFRIHSLPESKRYAETDAEYQIILDRQNKLINDLFGEENKIIISFGLYTDEITNDNYTELTEFGEFKKVQKINLHKIRPEYYKHGEFFAIYIKNDFWKSEAKNEILKAIANDEIRAMFICPSRECIIAPYDGGVDIVVKSIEKRNELKNKYKDWLSERKDGL